MNTTIRQILAIFELFRMTPIASIDRYEQEGKALLTARIELFVNRREPIMFFMLGYPFKSTNHRDKTIGTLPDLGEEVSLKNFGKFNDMVRQVYEPGIQIHIASDGYVFNDILGEFDRTVREYEEINNDLAKGSPVYIHNLTDFYVHSRGRLSDIREKLMTQWGMAEAVLQDKILNDPDTNILYRGMAYFMEEELAVRPYNSRNQLHKQAKILTREMMRRNEAFGRMVADEFKYMIKLSMHNSTNIKKLAFNLYPLNTIVHGSPWHTALLLRKNGTMETVKRKEAELAGHDLIWKDNRPYYFLES